MNDHDLDTGQVTELTRAWRDLDLQRADLVEQQDEIRARIRKLLVPGDRVDVDGKTVTCTANRRFDVEMAAALLEEPVRAICYTTALDSKKVKQHLTPALLDACMVSQGEPVVRLA
jgi:hypothetical protein